jgi:membrane protein YqaA with SNARE-associated domain
LLIALCLGVTARSFRYAALCLAGSIIGAVIGYGIGFFLWQNTAGEYTALAEFFFQHVFSMESFVEVGNLYDRYNFWIVFTAGFTPLPYKLFTITGGLFHINFAMFLVASIISRGLRFFLIAGLIWKFGAPIKSFIDKYFNLLAVIFTVLLVGSFILIGKLL